MEAFQALPAWAQFFLALVIAGVLLLLNIGWLMQARGWFQAEAEKQRRRRGEPRCRVGCAPFSGALSRAGRRLRMPLPPQRVLRHESPRPVPGTPGESGRRP